MTAGEILYGCQRRECALCRRLFSKVPFWRLARSLRSSGLKQNIARALRWESRTKHWDSSILCSPETETRATSACPYIYMPRTSVPVSILQLHGSDLSIFCLFPLAVIILHIFVCLDCRSHIEWIRGILKMLCRDPIMSVLATGISGPKVANIYPNEIINIFI